ncbi:hypothetical protein GCM10009630_52010 [Kribbella jejuensis]|uniref:Uncharacterized protein n=1 Tax=Kribbella jejuensis TaxID=236068 RepID=A0A542ET12_9ACTN|nr:hypothetical protein [Kribbella jejuensis]TQJ18509.1 hypothetical protein FB475_2654 [Kribbella jejuensis]
MRRVLLIGLLLLALALGVGGGYYTGNYLDNPKPTTAGVADPLGAVSASPTPSQTPSEPPLPVKTPSPSNLDPLQPGLDYATRTFTVHPEPDQAVQLSLQIPQGWSLTRDSKHPDEVKFLDDLRQRAVRVQSVAQAEQQTPAAAMAQLIIDLKKSQAPENDVQIQSHTTDTIAGDDGGTRAVATLIYTYIPGDTLRYVIVRWIAVDGLLANISMSITGIPADAPALDEILRKTSASVSETG